MDWNIIYSANWKPHAVSVSFADALVAEMHERGFEGEIVRQPLTKYGLDRGGMCRADRPVERFAFTGLDFGVTSEYVAHFHRQLDGLSPRKFGARTYYKLHCHWSCLVLTPALRQQLLRALWCRIDGAEARATVFYADKKPLNEVLVEAVERATGVELPLGAVGTDRHARFRKTART